MNYENYEQFYLAVKNSQPDLIDDYIEALYDHLLNPTDNIIGDRWYKLYKQQEKIDSYILSKQNTLVNVFLCAFKNLALCFHSNNYKNKMV